MEQTGITADPFGIGDAEGFGRVSLLMPSNPFLVGAKTTLQTLWVDLTCASSTPGISAAKGLRAVLNQGGCVGTRRELTRG